MLALSVIDLVGVGLGMMDGVTVDDVKDGPTHVVQQSLADVDEDRRGQSGPQDAKAHQSFRRDCRHEVQGEPSPSAGDHRSLLPGSPASTGMMIGAHRGFVCKVGRRTNPSGFSPSPWIRNCAPLPHQFGSLLGRAHRTLRAAATPPFAKDGPR